jgi:eukaryotic-like serine/threonine-protein kinase
MNSPLICPTCGSAHATATTDGFCPACMLQSALTAMPLATSFPISRDTLPRTFGAYELIEEIARGGMGVVYKARQKNLNRIVALKVLLGGAYSSESLLRRFQVEAEAAAALQHPGIVAIHEFGEHDHQPYYTMDYVEGQNLSQVTAGRPLPPLRAARYLQAIAEAVSFAHQHGILHRDLKPSNVLVDQNDRPRVADFGLAKRLHANTEATLAGQMLGSPNYAPPEQAAGGQRETSVRSDVYSLGGLLYTLLTGRPPFLASTVQETLRLVFEAEPVSPRVLVPTVPRDLETIALKCLEKDPARRYGSAQEFADELARFQRHEPILARPVAAPEQAWRWCRRHPAIAAVAATVIVALTLTSTIFYSAARRIEISRLQEQSARVVAQDNLYAAKMMVASNGFFAAGGLDPLSLRDSLDSTRPKAGERDVRGFEWRHFWYRGHSDASGALTGHQQVVIATQFSGNGKLIATQSADGNVRVWDAASRHELLSLEGVSSIGGFAQGDAELIISKPDNTLWRVDLATKKLTRARPIGGALLGVLPDGKNVVVLGPDLLPSVRPLDASAAAEKSIDLPQGVCSGISADGHRAAISGPMYPGIVVVDLATHTKIATLVDPRPVLAVALSPDGERLVSSGFDGVLKVWNVRTAREETPSFRAFLDPIWGLAFSADGRSLAAGGNNRTVGIWDTSSWKLIETLNGHTSTIRTLAFSPDGQQLVSGAEDEMALVSPTHARRLSNQMPRLLRGPEWIDRTPSIAFSPDSRFFAGSAADGQIKVWRSDTFETVNSFPLEARTVAFSSDGQYVLGEAFDGTVQRWVATGGGPGETLQPKAGFGSWQADPISPQQRVAVVAGRPETRLTCLCEISSARDGINTGSMLTASTLAMSPDGRTMYLGLPTGAVEIWDIDSRKRRFSFPAHKLGITALALSGDGQYLATGSLDNSTGLWDAASGRQIAVFRSHNRPVWALAFSPDGQTLAAGSCDKSIHLMSVPLRAAVAQLPLYVGLPEGYEQEVRLLRFSPDGNILAAALGDGTVRFFRAASFTETDASLAAAPTPTRKL